MKKKNGGVRIYVDLKPLNRCVRREHHPLPKVNDILGQLTGATMFTKLDTKSGFWQVPLAGCLPLSLPRSEGTTTINFSLACQVPQSTFNIECIYF